MSPTLIKINRKSIKCNPNAGDTKIQEYISTDCEVVIRGKHDPLDFKDFVLFRSSFDISKKVNQSHTYRLLKRLKDDSLDLGKLLNNLADKYPRTLTYHLKNNYQEFDLIHPAPLYLYEYQKTKVQCKECKKKFPYDQLKDESYDDDDYCTYVKNICPKCGEPDCCKIEFESIETVILKEAGVLKLVTGG